jgi:hypothetical protein
MAARHPGRVDRINRAILATAQMQPKSLTRDS